MTLQVPWHQGSKSCQPCTVPSALSLKTPNTHKGVHFWFSGLLKLLQCLGHRCMPVYSRPCLLESWWRRFWGWLKTSASVPAPSETVRQDFDGGRGAGWKTAPPSPLHDNQNFHHSISQFSILIWRISQIAGQTLLRTSEHTLTRTPPSPFPPREATCANNPSADPVIRFPQQTSSITIHRHTYCDS